MKFSELQSKSVKELRLLLAELREKQRELRFKISADQHKNVREIRVVKKTIAKILTLLRREPREVVKQAQPPKQS
ncbi:MAG: 50S ribosomal protein L29 [Patescibacteria group bacterium]|jgi:large subunit ribosomal protein L29